jgi:hypothetical protein
MSTLTEFLNAAAVQYGANHLIGAVVEMSLERPMDELIQQFEALGPYHRGTPGEWAHCFIIDQYTPAGSTVLEATIRDDETGAIIWNATLEEMIDFISQPGGSGGIYKSAATDYDDPRVHPLGLKIVQGLSDAQRSSIVTAGEGFLNDGYHYDVPGLFRELIRLLTGITLPAGDKLLFCSSYVQAIYRAALGEPAGNFVPSTVRSVDVTPDDLWYSELGTQIRPADVGL